MRLCGTLLIALTILGGCGDDSETSPPATDGGGGQGPAACLPTEILVEGACVPAGVQTCGEGFVADGDAGCAAVLPAEPCAPGTMALPGEETCRSVAPCGEAPWGDIPVEGGTIYVDGSYTGGSPDGSANAPFPTLSEGIQAAPAGGQVAIAAGSYQHDGDLTKPLRIWGRCPELVEIAGAGGAALTALFGFSGGEIRQLALTGPTGIVMSGPVPVLLDRVWIHDTGERGVGAEDTLAPVELTISNSLIERTSNYGIYNSGATVTLVDSVVRDVAVDGFTGYGRAVYAITNASTGGRATQTIRHSLLERSHELAVAAGGASLLVEDTLVRDTLEAGGLGRAFALQTEPNTGELTDAIFRRVVMQNNLEITLFVGGATATLEDCDIRDTLTASDGGVGHGIQTTPDPITVTPSTVVIDRSVVRRSHEFGMLVLGTDLTMRQSLVRDTDFGQRLFGRGMHLQTDLDVPVRSTATIDQSVFVDNGDVGLLVNAADLALSRSAILGTRSSPNELPKGDGLALLTLAGPNTTSVTEVTIRDSDRAGISAFSAPITLSHSRLECNAFDLNAEELGGGASAIVDGGGNRCGCEGAEQDCKAVSAGLEPPASL